MSIDTRPTRALPPALGDVLRSLGADPANAVVSRRREPEAAAGYLVLPSLRRPNLLVPLGPSGAVVVRERAGRGVRKRAVRGAVATALRTGLLTALPVPRLRIDDPDLDDLTRWLGDGTAGVRLAIMLGPPRANRKAVIRVLARDGSTLGYAKVGSTPLTRDLVRAEARNLALLAEEPPSTFTVPAVLRVRDEDPLSVVLTSPLADAADRRRPRGLPHGETRDLFRRHEDLATPIEGLPLFAAARYADRSSSSAVDLDRHRERLMTLVGSRRLPVGDSHGDWAPQNMAVDRTGLAVWDWERYATGVPQGLDAIHYQATFVDTRTPAGHPTEARFLEGLPDTLQRCGLEPRTAPLLLCLYLLWVARRYAGDLTLVPSESTLSRLRWSMQLLDTQLRMLESTKEHL